jgi:hypothetical protein
MRGWREVKISVMVILRT